MEDISTNILFIVGFSILALIGIFVFLLIGKSEQVNQLSETLNKMRRSFIELDEQAKLIVKTDLELNKAQEELDHRLRGLDALQKASRLISTTLDENEIFRRLDESLIKDLGFEKDLVLLFDKNKNLFKKVNIGYMEEEVSRIIQDLSEDGSLSPDLKMGYTYSSVKAPKHKQELISQIFDAEHFVLAPILTQSGIIGIFFVGNSSNTSPLTEGDEELISIIANQIGQSLENARLFEQVYSSSQVLETKIQDRTKELADALKEVQTISKTKSEFISAVSHELRTPLTSIKGYASLLMTGKLGEIPEKVKDRLEKINIHSDKLVKMINDLLDIARIESGRVEMNMAKCKFSKVIETVHDLLTPQMREKNIQWFADIDPKIPEMILDISQVERIFINLIGNAIKFTPVNGTISVKAVLDDNQMVLTQVKDTGIGISEEDMAKLFNEFFKVENEINANLKGTGLGLSLAKKIVEAHQGRIWVTSQLNQGTAFHFTLPITPKEKAA